MSTGRCRVVDENIDEAVAVNHTLSICNALAQSACPVSLFAGRLDKAERYIRLLAELTAGEGVVIWRTYALCFEGELLFRSGQSERGLDLLRSGVDRLRTAGFVQHRTTFLRALAIGLIDSRSVRRGPSVIEEALAEAIAEQPAMVPGRAPAHQGRTSSSASALPMLRGARRSTRRRSRSPANRACCRSN